MFYFKGVTEYADKVDGTLLYIILISIVLLLGVTFVMLYFVWRYSRKKNPVATQIHGNTTIEVVWTVIPTLLVITMFFAGYTDFKNLRNTQTQDIEIQVTARMWGWKFNYPNGTETDTVYIPVNKTVKFKITSVDVLHSFYIPAFRMKEDAVPRRQGFIFATPVKTGVYDIACAEYCGMNHWNMYTKVYVMEQDEFDKWYKAKGQILSSN